MEPEQKWVVLLRKPIRMLSFDVEDIRMLSLDIEDIRMLSLDVSPPITSIAGTVRAKGASKRTLSSMFCSDVRRKLALRV